MLISRGDIAGALSLVLTDPPYGEGVEQAKVRSIQRQVYVLMAHNRKPPPLPF